MTDKVAARKAARIAKRQAENALAEAEEAVASARLYVVSAAIEAVQSGCITSGLETAVEMHKQAVTRRNLARGDQE